MDSSTTPFSSIQVPIRRIRVEVVSGADARKVANKTDTLMIGTADGNDLVLTDRGVSRYHAEISRASGGFLVVDCGSTNGIVVNGMRIERAIVPLNTQLELGRTTIRIDDGDDELVEMHGPDHLGELRGRSPAMRQLMSQIERAARNKAPVLLIGESGTGKELIAKALHELSGTAGPLVTVDCGAMSANLIASELFGHERGAFTSADRQHIGAFERAHGGTLFLDEIGELPAELQATLLGALERRRFRRVGGQKDITVDIRVVSATNRDLRAEVNHNRFRLDLYFRLSVLTVRVPPLRDRTEDIPLLVEHFLREAGHDGWVEDLFPPDKMAELETHFWGGNVRELRNWVESTVALGERQPLETSLPPAGLAPQATPSATPTGTYKEARATVLNAFELSYLKALIARCQGNVSQAAREARMDRSHLITLLARHDLK